MLCTTCCGRWGKYFVLLVVGGSGGGDGFFVGWLVDWLAGWLFCMIVYLDGWLIRWLAGVFVGSVGWLVVVVLFLLLVVVVCVCVCVCVFFWIGFCCFYGVQRVLGKDFAISSTIYRLCNDFACVRVFAGPQLDDPQVPPPCRMLGYQPLQEPIRQHHGL